MIKHAKFIFLFFIMLALLSPVASYAVDQRCWTKATCEGGDDVEKGSFYQSDETSSVCGGETVLGPSGKDEPVGFCLAAGGATTKIDFAGKNYFENIGEFIKWIYKYGVVIASILAVVMIINAGFGWVISGGNTEKISHSKKRIGEAMMGLFLAVLSFFILNTVNPYLVNLRMPQVWKINTAGLSPQFCDMIQNGKKVKENQVDKEYKIDPTETKNTACGKDYYVEKTNNMTCAGRSCPEKQVCLSFDTEKNEKGELVLKSSKRYCWQRELVIHYKITGLLNQILMSLFSAGVPGAGIPFNVAESNWLDEDFYVFHGICESDGKLSFGDSVSWDATMRKINSVLPVEYIYYYSGLVDASQSQFCKTGKLVGFILHNEVPKEWSTDDKDMYIGQLDETITGIPFDELDLKKIGNNYIKLENLKKGVFLEVKLNDATLNAILKK